MKYPLISEYIESIKNSEDNFNELTNLRPVYDEAGEIVMSSVDFYGRSGDRHRYQ